MALTALQKALQQQRTIRGAGGTLQTLDEQETQKLAAQAGLQAPPTTPLGVGLIGGSPDQQKMAGTPAQKENALSLAAQPVGQTLQGAVRRQGVRSERTAEEQARAAQGERLGALGTLGDRAAQFVESEKQKLAQAAPVEVASAATATTAQGQTVDIGSLKDTLAELRKQPGNMDLMLRVNQALGYSIDRQLSPTEIDNLYESSVSAIARGAAGNIDEQLTVSDLLTQPEFGFDLPELSQLLGIPPESVAQLNIGQLRAEIDRVGESEFSGAAQLEELAGSSVRGAAEQGLARQAAREQSATGMRATEADYQKLEQKIARADKVLFAGKEMDVDELLSDASVSFLITEYLESPPDSEIRRAIERYEPEFQRFIQDNERALAEASKGLERGASEFQQIQADNRNLTVLEGTELDRRLVESLMPETRELRASRLNRADIPVLEAASFLSPEGRKQYAEALNSEVQRDPETAEELRGLSAGHLRSWEIGTPGGAWESNYIRPKRLREDIENAGHSVEKLVSIATGMPAAEALDRMAAGRSLYELGYLPGLPKSILDSDGNGEPDSWEQVQRRLLAQNPKPTLRVQPGENRVLPPVELINPATIDQQRVGDLEKQRSDAELEKRIRAVISRNRFTADQTASEAERRIATEKSFREWEATQGDPGYRQLITNPEVLRDLWAPEEKQGPARGSRQDAIGQTLGQMGGREVQRKMEDPTDTGIRRAPNLSKQLQARPKRIV